MRGLRKQIEREAQAVEALIEAPHERAPKSNPIADIACALRAAGRVYDFGAIEIVDKRLFREWLAQRRDDMDIPQPVTDNPPVLEEGDPGPCEEN